MRWLGGPKLDKWFYINVCVHVWDFDFTPVFCPPSPPPPTLQRDPMTSLMPRPWMPFGTEPSASTSPPTLKVWAMATVLSFTVRYVLYWMSFSISSVFFHFNGFTHNGGGGGSERAGFLLFYACLFFMSSFNWPLAVFVKDWKSREMKSNTQKGKYM